MTRVDVTLAIAFDEYERCAVQVQGVSLTMGGVYFAAPKGVVTKYGENLTPNGIN
jgi:hypothetical protein